jgi:hypothetical protein
MDAKIFDPAQFAPKSTELTEESPNIQSDEPKAYHVTGNSSRDSVRKLIFELFSGDSASDQDVALIVEAIEN